MWTPKELRKVILLVAGFIIMLIGAYLIVNKFEAKGSIDIKNEFVSGKIESGSVGLLFSFLGFMMCLFSIGSKDNSPFLDKLKNNMVFTITLILVVMIILVLIASFIPKSSTLAYTVLGILIFPIAVLVRGIVDNHSK